jgi:hypothetical protein
MAGYNKKGSLAAKIGFGGNPEEKEKKKEMPKKEEKKKKSAKSLAEQINFGGKYR